MANICCNSLEIRGRTKNRATIQKWMGQKPFDKLQDELQIKSDVGEIIEITARRGYLQIEIDSKWTPVEEFCSALSQRFPTITLCLDWREAGIDGAGRTIFQGGMAVETREGDSRDNHKLHWDPEFDEITAGTGNKKYTQLPMFEILEKETPTNPQKRWFRTAALDELEATIRFIEKFGPQDLGFLQANKTAIQMNHTFSWNDLSAAAGTKWQHHFEIIRTKETKRILENRRSKQIHLRLIQENL